MKSPKTLVACMLILFMTTVAIAPLVMGSSDSSQALTNSSMTPAFMLQDPADAPADAAAGDGKAPQAERSFLSIIFWEGGVIGWFIILMSIVTIALVIEHFVSIKRDKYVPPEIVIEIETLLEEEQYEEVLTLCESVNNYLTASMNGALAKWGEGHERMVEGALEAMDEENLKLSQKITYLTLIGNIAPMVGLFGTVFGMIQAFIKIAGTESPNPSELAGGIYGALVTTLDGLFVAMIALGFQFVFSNKVARLKFELGTVVLEFVDRLRPIADEPPPEME